MSRMMKKKNSITQRNYQKLLASIGGLLQQARQRVFQEVNSILVKTYWEIGRHIVLYEQKSKEKADYGSELLDRISHDLKNKYGKGFSRSNIFNFRRFYLTYPKIQTLSGFFSWSHVVELISIEDDLARSFYEKECIANRWSVRELERQTNSLLFERLALSKDKKGVLRLAKNGHKIEKAEDIVLGAKKDHILVEFALGGISNKLFASKYRLSLPDKRLLQKAAERIVCRERKLYREGIRNG